MRRIAVWLQIVAWAGLHLGFARLWLALGGAIDELDRWAIRALAIFAPLVGVAVGRRGRWMLVAAAVVAPLLSEVRVAQLLVATIGVVVGADVSVRLWPALRRERRDERS